MHLNVVKLTKDEMRNFSFGDGYLQPLMREYWNDEDTQTHYNEWCKWNKEDDFLEFEEWKKDQCLLTYFELRTRAWDYFVVDNGDVFIAWI